MKNRISKFLFAAIFAGIAGSAQAGPSVGKPTDLFIGCDDPGACAITLDEKGNISGSFGGFFGPYTVTLTHIASTVNAAYVDNAGNALEVTTYEVVGRADGPFGRIALQLEAGALGLCDSGVTADGSACTGANGDRKGDVLVFAPKGIDANGDGHTIIDFLSDVGTEFTFATDFNVLEIGPEDNNGAVHNAFGTDNNERMTYNITSDNGPDVVPEPGTFALVGLGLAALALRRRKV